MTTTDVDETTDAAAMEEAGALTERLFEATLGTMEVSTVWLGIKLGFYPALTEPSTAAQAAHVTGIRARYVQEWLEQQAIAGLVDVDAPGPRTRRFHVRPPSASCCSTRSPVYAGASGLLAAGAARSAAALPTPCAAEPCQLRRVRRRCALGQACSIAAVSSDQLTQEWFPKIPGVEPLLPRRGPGLDVGCGVGWSGIALAKAYPGLMVVGVDTTRLRSWTPGSTPPSRSRPTGSVSRFSNADATLSCPVVRRGVFLRGLHDLAHPVEALASLRSALRPGGVLLVMDEKADEAFAANGSPSSGSWRRRVLHCLPVGSSEPDRREPGRCPARDPAPLR